MLKLGMIATRSQMKRRLNDRTNNSFTEYYKPLMPRINKLRQVVVKGQPRGKKEDVTALFSDEEKVLFQQLLA